jgi:hypothetical protein
VNEPAQVTVAAQPEPKEQPVIDKKPAASLKEEKPSPPQVDPRLNQLVIKDWKARQGIYFDVTVQNNTGKAIYSFSLWFHARVPGRTVSIGGDVLFFPKKGSIEPGETVTVTSQSRWANWNGTEEIANQNWDNLEWLSVKHSHITFHDKESIHDYDGAKQP